MARHAKMKVDKFDKTMTMEVEVVMTHEFWARYWMAKQLFWLAGYILGCDTNVKFVE